MRLFKKSPKIFCIGHNKTGTTTIETVLKQMGYTKGNQVKGELLLKSWHQRDFKTIIAFCKKAQAFQDIPFSLPYTYQHLDLAFPNAKFILTERDSTEQWYESLTRFHSKLWADGKRIPTATDLKNTPYREQGFAYSFAKNVYGTPDDNIYDENVLKAFYEQYNATVKNYFKSRPEKLVVINVSNAKDYGKLCTFLNQPPIGDDFPWMNKTLDVKRKQ
ncbi:hypothetical protein SAMN04515667_2755 [Formosa sp. Hel1_31_208]|uniref:sulfotransferase n=1 Tax=Formosa sp. Hel1_31_208 TaxID=1798225 RepID=UPI00087C0915|nr:sulfotransferase [Formosa sp. Hel1_31_208]SDS69317.1 hypothetical protein SAMN04515667_2755 [Formosa sp. Hel1_31_208]